MLDEEAIDLRITLYANVGLIVFPKVAHLHIQQRIDGPADASWLFALIAADLVMFAAASVIAQLRRRLRSDAFWLSSIGVSVASGPLPKRSTTSSS